MENNLSEHPYFVRWTDPETGVPSYILAERVAPHQQSFYFTNRSLSADGRYLWFYAAFPPGPQKTLGVLSMDSQAPFVRHYPAAQFDDASPMVALVGDPRGPGCYLTMKNKVFFQPLEGEPQVVCTLDETWINGRTLGHLATHLTLSADRRYFLLDGKIGNHWWVGLGDTQTGEVEVLKEFGRNYNHAQFSPVNPGLFSIAQDWWIDGISGERFPFDLRIWLMSINGNLFEPLRGGDYFGHGTQACHEWWADDGTMCWTDYEQGVFEATVEDRTAVKVWQGPLCHSHCDPTRRYYCADESPYKWAKQPCKVLFYDRTIGKEIAIASGLPQPPYPRNAYHIDPHPQFSADGQYVIYTTTVFGKVDVALTRVEDVLARM